MTDSIYANHRREAVVAELHLVVPDSYVAEVRNALSMISGKESAGMSVTDIGREALGVYRWMLNEMARGNAVTSAATGEIRDTSTGALIQSSAPIVKQQIFTPGTAGAHSDTSKAD